MKHKDCMQYLVRKIGIAKYSKDESDIQWSRKITELDRSAKGFYILKGDDWYKDRDEVTSIAITKFGEWPDDVYAIWYLDSDGIVTIIKSGSKQMVLSDGTLNRIEEILGKEIRIPDPFALERESEIVDMSAVDSLEELYSMLPSDLIDQLVREERVTDPKLVALQKSLQKYLELDEIVIL